MIIFMSSAWSPAEAVVDVIAVGVGGAAVFGAPVVRPGFSPAFMRGTFGAVTELIVALGTAPDICSAVGAAAALRGQFGAR
ncbi:hypothetical protein M885DRAFT_574573 [Pelagophyceae sp. CCMP2097]|nr:hypothetical protein M885DRAFT_574573 [Pelagophyceae sp. CCMP2097]